MNRVIRRLDESGIRDQGIVESVVTEGGKNTASFLFRERTQQHKHEASKYIEFE